MEKTYRNIFAFKYTLMSQQPDIVTIICQQCHCYRWQIAAGIVDTSETCVKICRRCVSLIPVVHLDLRIYPRISEKIFETGMLWVWEETDSLKKPEAKFLATLSL
jgi:hypothetical protein